MGMFLSLTKKSTPSNEEDSLHQLLEIKTIKEGDAIQKSFKKKIELFQN